ncbi:MAG: DNA repair protein RadA [Fusobacterium sp.]|uniref:DNA repair protein RadA n=1 Tax=Fusobacterium sp. TaxID=68766 RepID=UPI0026DCB659|nr:DNA repair protein RadA [Fusobacterium sp.]MDO4690641.1 DNA repair protein RadA [Fusobacterium sp.]
MARLKMIYSCIECGYRSPKWVGKCPQCGSWSSFEEEEELSREIKKILNSDSKNLKVFEFKDVEYSNEDRYKTGIEEFDRLLGGGLLKGEVVLVTGNPGIGKSTLLLQVIAAYKKYGDVLYISGEESVEQIKNRGDRLKILGEKIYLMSEMDILNIYEYIVNNKPKVVVVDSIQTLYNSNLDSISGTTTQIRECTLKIIELAKKHNISFFIVGHITKDGKVAGPKLLEHMVDAVFNFEGEEGLFYRVLRSSKNRFGSTNEIAVFSMEENGMKEVKNSSEYFLSEREEKNIGSMVVPILEGTKVFILEIQALITDSTIGIPKRVVQGYDRNRIQILTAIAEKKMNIPLGLKDLFVNVPGGLAIKDPAADLGVLISILSVFKGFSISQKIAAVGELGLRGEIRKVFFLDKRLRELEKLGFTGVYVPEANRKEIEKKKYKLKLIFLKNLDDLLERMKKND